MTRRIFFYVICSCKNFFLQLGHPLLVVFVMLASISRSACQTAAEPPRLRTSVAVGLRKDCANFYKNILKYICCGNGNAWYICFGCSKMYVTKRFQRFMVLFLINGFCRYAILVCFVSQTVTRAIGMWNIMTFLRPLTEGGGGTVVGGYYHNFIDIVRFSKLWIGLRPQHVTRRL